MYFQPKSRGLSLIEVMIMVAILAILVLITVQSFKHQLHRSYDGRRKADLAKIKTAFEDYYNDYQCYPPANTLEDYCSGTAIHTLDDYLKPVPCDPQTGKAYLYKPFPNNNDACGGFRVYAALTNADDADIATLRCNFSDGCGTGLSNYNYGVSDGVAVSYHQSGDVPDTSGVTPTSTPTPTVGTEPTTATPTAAPTDNWCCVTSSQSCNSWDGVSECTGGTYATLTDCQNADNGCY